MKTKYIFVTGGVVSSVGKGICAASIGMLLKNRGFKVSIQKLDPYLNIDAGTMNPFQHGEVFVSDDGAETDLDLGHYERFVDVNLSKLSNITSGKIYYSVIDKERQGVYNGGTVQVIPHVTNEIKDKIKENAQNYDADVAIIEIGGTVGDIEGQPFMEAIRQFKIDVGIENVIYIHVALITTVGTWNELKTKPAQHSVIQLREAGIQPDMLICRSKEYIEEDMKEKLSLFCDIPKEAIFEGLDADTIYAIPLEYERDGVANYVLKRLGLKANKPNLKNWENIVNIIRSPEKTVKIGVVGKYVDNGDSYISIGEAIKHAAIAEKAKGEVEWIDSESITEKNISEKLSPLSGIIIAGGFGARGVIGKMLAIKYARENKIPFLGICYGLHWAVIESLKNILNIKDVCTTEVDPHTSNPVIHLLPDQNDSTNLGGTMRLGAYICNLKKNTLVESLYGKNQISERHRHRYEVNNEYREIMQKSGLILSGISEDGKLVEIVERDGHPFFIAVQFHPEFKSRPDRPHEIFSGLIKASLKNK